MSKETLSTSETKKETPKLVNALEQKYQEEAKEESHATRLDPDNIDGLLNQLPEPSGYRILLLPFTPKAVSYPHLTLPTIYSL